MEFVANGPTLAAIDGRVLVRSRYMTSLPDLIFWYLHDLHLTGVEQFENGDFFVP